ncbi:MAG TPA: triose-phosphate isomerase [Candidatus Baltobacteraceae bacterium]|jgi:triosephosphate isomerase
MAARRLVAGNWKMFKTADAAVAFVDAFLPLLPMIPENIDIVLCPPFTALDAVARRLRGHDRVALGAQNMHWESSGAFTGEIAPPMLTDLGVRYVILGHSERRQYFGETDEAVCKKTIAALTHGLTPIVAVGETLAERDAGLAHERVVSQTRAALHGLAPDALAHVVLAYEPVWAIGTGRNCEALDADAIMQAIRTSMHGLTNVPILYGGSVKPENVPLYVAQPNIDGALVGGASLDPEGFANLLRAACEGRCDAV